MAVTYEVDVSRGERYWLVDVPAVQRATQARTLREVDAMARDLIAIMTDVPADSFELTVRVTLPQEAQEHLQRAAGLREKAASAQSRAAMEVRLAAPGVKDDGMTLRDIGDALGVSYQRAHQLVSSVKE